MQAIQSISNIFSSVSNAISSANAIFSPIANVVSSSTANLTSRVLIANSGSTNSNAWLLTINQDGSGSIAYQQRGYANGNANPKNATFMAGTFSIGNLTAMLNQINVSDVGRGSCAHSVSFGTITTISYGGRTSGDVYCLRPNDSAMHPLYGKVATQVTLLSGEARAPD
jgi:hypothetical protein